MLTSLQNQLTKMQKLSEISEQFLQLSSSDPLDYQMITDVLLELSGGKFAIFNLIDQRGENYHTEAFSGNTAGVEKALKLAGINLAKKVWAIDPVILKKTSGQITTHFESVYSYAGSVVPELICLSIQKMFHIGELILVKIMIDKMMIGDFVIFMDADVVYDSEALIEIYSRQVGLVISRFNAENALMESEINFKALFEKGPIGIAYHKMIYNKAGKPIDYLFLDANAAYKELTGIDPIGLTVTQAFPGIEKDPFDWIGTFGKVAKTGKQIRFQQYLQSNQRWYDCVAYQYQPDHFVAAFFEITEKKAIEKSLEVSESLHKEILSGISDAILIIDENKMVKFQSENCKRIFGWEPTDLIGKGYYRFVHPEDVGIIRGQFSALLTRAVQHVIFECRVMGKDGTYRTVEISAANRFDHPSINGILATMHDITDRKLAETDLKASEEKYRIMTENISDVISIYNLTQGKTTFVSPSITQQRGVSVEEAMNEKFEEACTPDSYAMVMKAIEKHSKDYYLLPKRDHHHFLEVEQYRKDKTTLWTEIASKYQFNSKGELEMLIVSRNIDDRKKAEKERDYLNFHDHLTGLYNRRFFEAELHRLDVDRNMPITIIMGDVNGLKLINDSFGHAKGDELLAKVAEVIQSQFREDEIISRLSGDEFAIVLPKTTSEIAKLILERLNNALSQHMVADLQLSVSFGFGVKENKNQSLIDVLKQAEDVMYRVKLSENRSSKSQTIDIIMNALFEKSKREQQHSKRVSLICEKMAFAMGYDLNRINQIKLAGLVHDIGKIGVDDGILNKEGSLTPTEWIEIKKHPEAGWRILNSVSEFSELSESILAHHERYDGKGYPSGLKGKDIPIESRILAIADAYDAMTGLRSYRQSKTDKEAREEIRRCSGSQFDPELVLVFESIKLK